jgi:hypothetical protein
MIAVARWFVSTLWGSYASRCTNGLTEKKPYNPILGEQFYCHLGRIKCTCEQGIYIYYFLFTKSYKLRTNWNLLPGKIVSHHPPVSAFYLEDEENGISLNGHCMKRYKHIY